MKNKLVIGVIILILGGVWLNQGLSQDEDTAKSKSAATVKIEQRDVHETVTAAGRVVTLKDVQIKCKASGLVISLPHQPGDQVKEGDLLLELDPVDEKRNVRKAESSLETTLSQLAQSETELTLANAQLELDRRQLEGNLATARVKAQQSRSRADRLKKLQASRVASMEEYESAESQAVQAENELRLAQIRVDELKLRPDQIKLKAEQLRAARARADNDRLALEQAQQRLTETRVMSPLTGVITTRDVQEGQIISSGISNVGGGTSVMTVSDLSRIFVIVNVDESDVARVKPGQEATVTLDAFRKRIFRGEVVQVAPRGVSQSNVVTFEVKIEVNLRGKDNLRPEMTADVEILVEQKDGAMVLPTEAVRTRGRRGGVVYVRKGEEFVTRTVEVGLVTPEWTEIISGLSAEVEVRARAGALESRWQRDGQGRRGGLPFMRGGRGGGRH